MKITKAQSLIEMAFALGLLAILLPLVSILVLEGYLSWIKTHQFFQASFLAKEGIEASILIGQRDWEELSPGEHGLKLEDGIWFFWGSQEEIPFLRNGRRKILVEVIDPERKKIISKVSFEDERGNPQEISFFLNFTLWKR